MKNWHIGKRIIFGFTVVTLIAVGLGVFAEFQLRQIKRNTSRITGDCLPGLRRSAYLAESIHSLANENSTLALKHIMAPDEDLKADFECRIQTNLLAMSRTVGLYGSSTSDAEERKLAAAVAGLCQAYQGTLTGIIRLSKSGSAPEAMELKQHQLEPPRSRPSLACCCRAGPRSMSPACKAAPTTVAAG